MNRQDRHQVAIVDDDEYWRDRIPEWLDYLGLEFDTFSNYREFEKSLKRGKSYAVVLGDYIISTERSKNGLLWLESLLNTYDKSMDHVYLYTVKTLSEVVSENGRQLPDRITYLSKENDIEALFEGLFSYMV